ncbi:uncharacterized protein RAG0_03462 [Rhynchosporium agropyri]|uniref:Uncharacterized protein n=1 Tax=Rhynchosporium agropyri TaxID=914238 RepID=A0A1E1K4E5_9HELO|nr:uncharacterized protein RAG0_03462 [Rhynchosporium agropyri]
MQKRSTDRWSITNDGDGDYNLPNRALRVSRCFSQFSVNGLLCCAMLCDGFGDEAQGWPVDEEVMQFSQT